MEMLLGAMVVALLVKAIPAAIVDTFATLRAATAGEWGLIDKERDRKHQRAASRREAVSKAWQATRARRNKQAGGDGTYRPGMAAYLGDVYHGLWEDQLEARHARRAARPPVGPDGRRPKPSRLDQAVEAKVGRQRSRTGYVGRVARLLIDPVGERRQPADVVPPRSDGRGDAGSAGGPVDPWPFDGDEPTINLAADGPRTACPVCGDTLTSRDGGWDHPRGSTCALGYPLDARRPDGGYAVPQRVAEQATELYRLNRAEGRTGALGETQTARDLRGMFGDQYPQHVYDQAAADAQHVPDPHAGMEPIQEHGSTDTSDGETNMSDGSNPATRFSDSYQPPTLLADVRAETRVGQAMEARDVRSTVTSDQFPKSSTINGGTTVSMATTTDINTNEDARQAFAAMAAAAAEANDAIAALEAAKAKMAAAANGTADGMSAKAFDVDATTAAAEAAEAISLGTLADWSERIDAVLAAAERGIKALDKYRDSEDVVASNNIDPTTLAATSS